MAGPVGEYCVVEISALVLACDSFSGIFSCEGNDAQLVLLYGELTEA